MKPAARRDGLVVREIGDETIVYDGEHHQAHCLNRTASLVFRLCDGTRAPQEIATRLGDGADPAAREALVSLALERLSSAKLLVADDEHAHGERVVAGEEHGTSTCERSAGGTSRRELLRLGALALPAIASIVAPTPAQAASGCVPASQCNDSSNFCRPCDLGCDGSYVCDPLNFNECVTSPAVGCL